MLIEIAPTLLTSAIDSLPLDLAALIALTLVVLGGAVITLWPRTFLTPRDRSRSEQPVRLDDSGHATHNMPNQEDIAHQRRQRLTNATRDERA